jgi:sugar transferase EpsL
MKRGSDLLASLCALAFLTPLLLLVSVSVFIAMGRPILFIQARPGRGGHPFLMYKFRTMAETRSHDGTLESDGARLTRLGRFLRSTSLDELPELWNVLRGDMSLVGPRPLLMEYLDLYTPRQARRHEVRPGITGWAQVNGRNAISWEERFELDVWYVENQSFLLDLKILFMTVIKVFAREGISAPGEATVSRFTGSRGGQNHG